MEDKEGLGIEPVMANEDLRQGKMEEGPGKTEGPVWGKELRGERRIERGVIGIRNGS